ncbi:DUF6670 family protein [Gordonia hydrophobica]|uniref:DUF6670 family protein n=1 Tax=Gordonia hydrophobica TaxID=40516 RepID=A0ABZ2TWG6_9ACTN|nr:DUF6670 family protein [Gordonia hydrophobica]MBM7365773.1 hypothetical protein [Gordonia hydrophobica]
MNSTDPRPVAYSSADRHGGLRRIAVDAATRLMRAANQDRVVRTGLPEQLTFPPSSTERFGKGAAHYGIMIADLPEPHRFLANMIIIGATGFKAWDDNGAFTGAPRGTCQLGWGTAALAGNSFHVFAPDDVRLEPAGRSLEFGDDYRLDIDYPEIRVRSTVEGLDVDLVLTSTDVVSWVADSAFYRHFSFLCTYTGTVGVTGETPLAVSGTGTFEYGIGYLPYMDLPRPLPRPLKLPADFFSYHVIDLDAERQLVAVVLGAFGDLTAGVGAEVRSVADGAQRFGDEVSFEVLDFAPEPQSYRGRSTMPVPVRFRWTFTAAGDVSEIHGTVDTPWLYAGIGYIAGYSWSGEIDGEPRNGRGYVEYADRR